MKINHAAPFVILLTAFGLATSNLLAEPNGNIPASPSAPMPSRGAAPVTGTVQTVDTTNNSVQIKDSFGNLQTVVVDNNTQILRAGSIVQLAELHNGDIVTVKNTNSTM